MLAHWRMRVALKAIPASLRNEVLDVGCGSYPLFLIHSPFRRKVGLDQIPALSAPEGVEWVHCPLGKETALPFPDGSFDCVTSLAFLEHLDPEALPGLLSEMHRVLKPSGRFVATTPHAFADGVLRFLSRVNLVSREEIDEHKIRFRHAQVRSLLRNAGFPKDKIAVRGFQLGMNILMVADK
jgi:SAM-dependent methyltransferase